MSDDAKKLVLSLWGAAFRQGELEHRESVSDAMLKKNSDAVLAAQFAIMSEIERLRAKIDAMNAAAASLKGACVCRFDENDKLVKECAFHGDMRRALEDKQP